MADGDSSGGGYDWAIPLVMVLIGWYLLSAYFTPTTNEILDEDELEVSTSEEGYIKLTEKNNEQGSSTASSTTNSIKIPDNWPKSVPIPAGVDIEYSATKEDQDGKEVLTTTYSIKESAKDVNDYYLEELIKNDWDIEIQTDTGNGFVISAEQGNDETVSVFITGLDKSNTSVTLSVKE